VPEHLRASGIGWYSTTVGLLQLVASVVAGCCGIGSAMGRLSLWCSFCRCGQRWIARVESRKHENALRH